MSLRLPPVQGDCGQAIPGEIVGGNDVFRFLHPVCPSCRSLAIRPAQPVLGDVEPAGDLPALGVSSLDWPGASPRRAVF